MADPRLDEALQVQKDEGRSDHDQAGRSQEDRLSDRDFLYRTIESEIIPRLMMVQCNPNGIAHTLDNASGVTPTDADIVAFCAAIVSNEELAGARFVGRMRARGCTIDRLFLDLLAPAARLLGDKWTTDDLSFTEVTVGLSRMQNLLRDLTADSSSSVWAEPDAPTVMFLPAPGEQHTFGIIMVEEMFRRAGYHVATPPGTNHRELIFLVRQNWYDVVGFSLSCDQLIDKLAWAIRAVRRASRNTELRIIVGGRAFAERADLVQHCGADACALDGLEAVQAMPTLIGNRQRAKMNVGNSSKRQSSRNGDTRQTP
ncbi:MAG: cobalamin B12-binding domain-containing protein [Hyphomicrobiales bacterium]